MAHVIYLVPIYRMIRRLVGRCRTRHPQITVPGCGHPALEDKADFGLHESGAVNALILPLQIILTICGNGFRDFVRSTSNYFLLRARRSRLLNVERRQSLQIFGPNSQALPRRCAS
ncbi:MAG: hypothetical protein HY650_02250 [Acidobacteria bacterium]|nr:hypothetical protein [Acidobacteriota bacterium]